MLRRGRQRLDLLIGLIGRELLLRYHRSVLGIAWTMLNPLLQLAVLYVVFGTILNSTIPRFGSFIFAGLLVWNWTAQALNRGTVVILAHRELLLRPAFPLATLPVVNVLSEMIHFLLALPILVLFLRLEGVTPGWPVLLLPLVMAVQLLLTTSIGFLLAAAHVTFRDTQHTVQVLLPIIFWASGVFYQVSDVPPPYYFLLMLNPMIHLIDAYRAILINGALPDALPLLAVATLGLALLPIGLRAFHRQRYRFVEDL